MFWCACANRSGTNLVDQLGNQVGCTTFSRARFIASCGVIVVSVYLAAPARGPITCMRSKMHPLRTAT